MENYQSDLSQYLQKWSNELSLIRQNQHLDQSALIAFARKRGTSQISDGDPATFQKQGWLSADDRHEDGRLLFHPFRYYPLSQIVDKCRLRMTAASTLSTESTQKLVAHHLDRMTSIVNFLNASTKDWNKVVDLCILLEPVYWPLVTGWSTRPGFETEGEFSRRVNEHRTKVHNLVRSLDPSAWQRLHESLRLSAAQLDWNDSLYLLLRFSKWTRRDRLEGPIAGALWFRHMGEMIRLVFEEVHQIRWLEEDQGFGQWLSDGRTMSYGSERPLDDPHTSRTGLAFHFGLFTGSVVRWYVEGDTEYHAILKILQEPSMLGIELVNLRGNIATNRPGAAQKLTDDLRQDREQRRFSMISFDLDVKENTKTMRKHIQRKDIVGYITPNNPDFEFFNFTLDELIEIVACMDEKNGFNGDSLRNADWGEVSNGRKFEERYLRLSSRKPRSLKGAEWGVILAEYAIKNQKKRGGTEDRPLWAEIRIAVNMKSAHYGWTRDHSKFDPDTFELTQAQ
jgi:hypothetical protein